MPKPLTSFVGRASEIAEVRRLLRTRRLLTLTGPGGIGKTRLAIEAAQGHQDVAFVQLAPLTDGRFVAPAIGAALGINEDPRSPWLDLLVTKLDARETLVILDNCEHVVEACAEVTYRLLQDCPGVRIAATSRQSLAVSGEQLWPVPPLTTADTSVSQVADIPAAMQLFIERAQLVQPDFQLNDQSAALVADMCRRLDGIPLAIELAAARLRFLGLEMLCTRLNDQMELRKTMTHGVPVRHQTLHAAIEWSYELLSEVERSLLRGLSVFAGGWTDDAAEAILADGGGPPEAAPDLLERLIDRSLVQTVTDGTGTTRYRMLETIRQFARARLEASGEASGVLRRHAEHYLHVVERAAQDFSGTNQVRIAALLELEHDNLRAALQWCIARRDAELGLRVGAALARFWLIRGHNREGRDWLQQLLEIRARAGSLPHLPDRAEALSGAGFLALRQSNFAVARDLFKESLTIRCEVGDVPGVARCLSDLGVLADEQGDFVQAIALHEQSQAIRSQLSDRLAVGTSLNNLGIAIAHQSLVLAIAGQGRNAEYQQNYARARRLVEDALAIRREFGDLNRIADSLLHLGYLADWQSDYSTARHALGEALVIARDLGSEGSIMQALQGFSALAAVEDQAERALLLDGAAARLRELLGMPLAFAAQQLFRHRLARARDMIGNLAADAAWNHGHSLALDQAVACALEPSPE